MAQKVTKTIKRLYDAHLNEDFSIFDDGLNPKRNMEFEELEHKLMDYVDGTLTKIEQAFEETEEDRIFTLPSSESFRGKSREYEAFIGGQFIPGNGSIKSFVDQNLGRILEICAKAGAQDPHFRIERVLDCHGVSSIIISNDDDNENGDNDNGNNSLDKNLKVRYVCETSHDNPTEINKLPYILLPPLNPDGKIFDGWYSDKDFTQDLNGVIGYVDSDELTIYAKFIKDDSLAHLDGDGSDEYGEDTANVGNLADPNQDKPCFKVDLWILQIILIILQVIDILITIMSIAMYITATVSRMVAQAAQCWVNPAALAELISDVITGLIPIIFKVVAQLIVKLLSSLQLDCVTNNVYSVMARIFAVLAGCRTLVNQVTQTAVGLKAIGSAFDQLMDSLEESASSFGEEFKKSFKNLGEELDDYFKPENIAKMALDSAIQADGGNMMGQVEQAVATGIQAKDAVMDIKNAIEGLKETFASFGSESKVGGTPVEDSSDSKTSEKAEKKAKAAQKKAEREAKRAQKKAEAAARKATTIAGEANEKLNGNSMNLPFDIGTMLV